MRPRPSKYLIVSALLWNCCSSRIFSTSRICSSENLTASAFAPPRSGFVHRGPLSILFIFKSPDFVVQIPASLLQVLYLRRRLFEARSPDVLHRVAEVEVHPPHHGDALHSARVRDVVARTIHRIKFFFHLASF